MIRRLVFYNAGWKLLSLLVAVVFWYAVANEPELSTFTNVQVQYKDMPADLEISSDVQEAVSLELRGPSGDLGRNALERPSVILDMRDAHSGQRTYTIGKNNVKLPPGIQLVRSIPSQVRIQAEPRGRAQVAVNPEFTNIPAGYEVAQAKVTPPTLTVVGPQSAVQRIQKVATDQIDLSTNFGTAQYRTTTYANDPHIRFTSDPRVTVEVTMKRK